jgi:oligosaccharide repeat unit polymerase
MRGVSIIPRQKRVGRPPWWINPFWYCTLFLLPLFLAAVYAAGPYLPELDQKINNLSTRNILLGVLSIGMLAAGSLPFAAMQRPSSSDDRFRLAGVNRALAVMGYVALLCYLTYLSPLVLHPDLVVQFLSGGDTAMYILREDMVQVPGITSFMHADLPFYSLYSASMALGVDPPVSKANRRLFAVLLFLVSVRAIFGAERLALVEALVAYGIPRVAFAWRPGILRASLPLIGIAGVFVLFSFGEYFRSWQYYRMYYPNFWDFISVRFFGYFVTSINNGAGLVSHYQPTYLPLGTIDGFYKLTQVFGFEGDTTFGAMVTQYLSQYATLEFNNYGGLYVPYLDYGTAGGAICFLVAGLLTGYLYRAFRNRSPLGLILYPSWFMGLLDIIRIWIWGSSRFLPVILVACLAAMVLRTEKAQPQRAAGASV